MSNSSLVDYKKLSPHIYGPRTQPIDTITIHCVVGQCTVEGLGATFSNPNRAVSANYGIGRDGKIGLYVEEKNASQCSSNRPNDNRAITIEVASDTTPPYAVNSAAYNSLINLLVDICKRNGIKELKWKADKSLIGQVEKQNMTVHRWFANKSCPGEYLYSRHGQIADAVNKRLGATQSASVKLPADKPKFKPYKVRISIDDLNIRKGPGTNYAAIGKYTGKGVFTIVQESKGKGSKKGWGKLKSGAGWISLDYAKKI